MMQKDGRSERRRALDVNIRKPMCGGVSNVNKGNLNLFTHLLLFTDLDTLIDTYTHTLQITNFTGICISHHPCVAMLMMMMIVVYMVNFSN